MKPSLQRTIFILCSGLVLSLGLFFLVKNWEESNRLREFTYKSIDHAAAIQTEFEHLASTMEHVRALIQLDVNMEQQHTRIPFMPAAEQLLLHNSALLTLAWTRVETRTDGSEHLVVRYLNHGDRPHASEDDLQTGMSYDQHIGIATSTLLQSAVHVVIHEDTTADYQHSDHEMNFIAPVQAAKAGTAGRIIGALVAEFSIETLIERAVAKLPVAAQDIRLYLVDGSGERHLLHTHISRSRNKDEIDIHTGLVGSTVPFDFSGQHWQLEFEAAPRFFRQHPIILAWQSLLIGLLLTFALAWYAYSSSHQKTLIRQEVDKRTKDLSLLATVIDQADEVVVITNQHNIIEYVNPAFTQVTGYSADEAIGQTPALLKSGQHSSTFYKAMWDTLHQGKVWREDFINRNKQGEYYTVQQSITPIMDEQGSLTAFVSVQRDVTHARKVEQQLHHLDRVDSLGMLAGGIAHDFNNLLTAILGHASAVGNRLEADSPIRASLNEIVSASNTAASLCNQMLTYSGKGRFEVQPVDLSRIAIEMRDFLQVSIPKDIHINCQLNQSLPAIDADISQMQQVIMNLVTNASEAMAEHSRTHSDNTLTIESGVLHISNVSEQSYIGYEHMQPGSYVYLEVADTGCGMDTETIQKIFDPYFSTKFTGRGLGMSAVLGIVKSHRGGLQVHSIQGQGSRIRVVFPASRQQAQSAPAPARVSNEQFSGTVLVVDDEPLVRTVATVMLEDLGLEVLTANDGIEGVQVFRQHQQRISLVLLDLTMPKMDGKTCFEQLKNIQPDVQVFISSGYSTEDVTEQFSHATLAGFIHKPYSQGELADKIRPLVEVLT